MLITNADGYTDNPLRQDLWRAGHAHAGVLLILSLVILRYIDEAQLSERAKALTRVSAPIAAILLPVAFFLSVLPEDASAPNVIVYLAYLGGLILIAGLLTLGVGLFKASR
jgi:ABC-type Mn2+/Zn2+ transport system permease subunit